MSGRARVGLVPESPAAELSLQSLAGAVGPHKVGRSPMTTDPTPLPFSTSSVPDTSRCGMTCGTTRPRRPPCTRCPRGRAECPPIRGHSSSNQRWWMVNPVVSIGAGAPNVRVAPEGSSSGLRNSSSVPVLGPNGCPPASALYATASARRTRPTCQPWQWSQA